jgi:signal peptidase
VSRPVGGLLAVAGGLAIGTLVLALPGGWASAVVVSGSMSPAVEAGDVVVTSPLPAERVRVGHVIRFHHPTRPGRSVLHRVTGITGDGLLVTKGDANRTADAAPVPTGAVTGVERLRVPYLGLPLLWWRERDYRRIAVTAGALTVLCLLVPRKRSLRRTRRPIARTTGEGATTVRSRRSGRRPS